MSVKILNQTQKQSLVKLFQQGSHPKQLAKHFNVSDRTVNRVLEEFGEKLPSQRINREQERQLQVIAKHGLDSHTLEAALNQPSFTVSNIVKFLSNTSHTNLVRLLELVQQVRARKLAEAQKRNTEGGH